jgi:general stress protein YciG
MADKNQDQKDQKQNQNQSSNDESMSTAEAGRMGGQETAKRGPEFYSEIGQKQGKENNPGNLANDPEKARGEQQQNQDDSDE